MKFLPVLMLWSQLAFSQVKTGTVIYANFEKDEITIAADSRINIPGLDGHDDMECKIVALSPKSIFSLAGIAERSNHWDAFEVARQTWKIESKKTLTTNLLNRVVSEWLSTMEKSYADPYVIKDLRAHMKDEPIVATAIFAAVDNTGTLRMEAVDISFDSLFFDSTQQVKLVDKITEIPAHSHISMGHDEVVIEFHDKTTQRAKDYMAWYERRLAGMTVSQSQAELASKFIELSILLHPDNSELGFPIEVLQLRPGTGVHWISHKPKCRNEMPAAIKASNP
jgi:hypothetical protein